MEQLIGNKIYVSLKEGDETISGLLIHVEEHYVYIQMEKDSHMYVVPKANVRYYITDNLPGTSRILGPIAPVLAPIIHSVPEDTAPIQEPRHHTPAAPTPRSITVFVNGDAIANIPVTPSLDLKQFTNDTMKIILGNPDVQAIIAGRVQKSIEYAEGKVYITTMREEEENVPDTSHESNGSPPNTFSMGGNPTQDYMSGQQMVSVLNKAASKGGNKE